MDNYIKVAQAIIKTAYELSPTEKREMHARINPPTSTIGMLWSLLWYRDHERTRKLPAVKRMDSDGKHYTYLPPGPGYIGVKPSDKDGFYHERFLSGGPGAGTNKTNALIPDSQINNP